MKVSSCTAARRAAVLVLAIGFVGCGGEAEQLGQVPEGWERDAGKWWMAGTDTATAFRAMGDLQEMGVASDMVYASNAELARQSSLQRNQLTEAVKRALVRLYRNEPQVVDSLFDQVVTPLLDKATLQGDPDEIVEAYKKRAYQALRRHFREPSPRLQLGTDIAVPYPDSLRRKGVTGAVRMQVRLDREGNPVAVELIEGLHPVLNDIALRATTEMRWQPAYLLRRNDWEAIPSWARFNIHFASAGSETEDS